MKSGKPSYTAEVVAYYRAVESLRPDEQRVCYDPIAMHFLRTGFKLLCRLGPLVQPIFWLLAERGFPEDVAQSIARTRFIDDYVKQCVENGIEQMVILGAGYDSRAYRIDGVKEKVKVFEIDCLATQIVKKLKLAKLLGCLPTHVTYVPIDFGSDKLERKLYDFGYDKALKTLFIWEGVTYFISSEAIDETLRFVRDNSGKGSSIIFDYALDSVLTDDCDSVELSKLKKVLSNIGEPYIFGIKQGCIGDFLASRGFCDVVEATPEFINDAYFKSAKQTRKMSIFFPLAYATVAPKT
ncbi:MAG: SAM-dependent methyltransferase [Candidatus Methylumidiphilus sp.]